MTSKLFLSTVLFFAIASPALSQDLQQLQNRARQLWQFRSEQKKIEAIELIEPATRNLYLQLNEIPFSSFKISGFDFTDDLTRVDVLTRIHALVPQIGEMDKVVRETWIWKDGKWLMHAEPFKSMSTMFDSVAGEKSSAPIAPDFKVKQATIDVGRHVQGDTIEGKIAITGNRDVIRTIRPLQKISGLSIGLPVWTSASEGYLTYRWETMLLSQNIDQKIQLEAIANNDATVAVEMQFRARIDGVVRFKQVPEIVDPLKSGQLELQLENLSKTPLKILSVMAYNPAYVVDEDVPPVIEPSKTGRLLVRYSSQAEPAGASIGLVLSEEIGHVPSVTVPLNVQLPEAKKPAGYTQEEIKKLLPAQPQLPTK